MPVGGGQRWAMRKHFSKRSHTLKQALKRVMPNEYDEISHSHHQESWRRVHNGCDDDDRSRTADIGAQPWPICTCDHRAAGSLEFWSILVRAGLGAIVKPTQRNQDRTS